MPPKATVWLLDPHTKRKHVILRRYLEAWLPIMAKFNQRILFIDGFAGPGEYSGGGEGSPVIALKTARDHTFRPTSEVVFIFVEKDRKRYDHLKQVVNKLRPTLPDNFKVGIEHGSFDETMTSIFKWLDGGGEHRKRADGSSTVERGT